MSINLENYNFNKRQETSTVNEIVEKQKNEYKHAGGRDANLLERTGAMIESTWIAPSLHNYATRPDFKKDEAFTDSIKSELLFEKNIHPSQFKQYLETESQDEWDQLEKEFKDKEDLGNVMGQMGTVETLAMGAVVGTLAPESLLTGAFVGGGIKAVQAARLAKSAESVKMMKMAQKLSPKNAVKAALATKATPELLKDGAFVTGMEISKKMYSHKNMMKDIGIASFAGAGENALLTAALLSTDPTMDTEEFYKNVMVDAAFGGILGGTIGGAVIGRQTKKATSSINEYDALMTKKNESIIRVGEMKQQQADFLDKYQLEKGNINATNKFIDKKLKNAQTAKKGKETQKQNIDSYATIMNLVKKMDVANKLDKMRGIKRYLTDEGVGLDKRIASATGFIKQMDNLKSHLENEMKAFDNGFDIKKAAPDDIANYKSLTKQIRDINSFIKKAEKDPIKSVNEAFELMDTEEITNARFVDEKMIKENLSPNRKAEYESLEKSLKTLTQKTKDLATLSKSHILDYSFDDAVMADMADPVRKETFDYLLTLQKNDDIEGVSINYYADADSIDVEADANDFELKNRTKGVARGFTEKLGIFQNYLDRTANFGDEGKEFFSKVFRMSARKDHGIVDESVEEAKNTLEASFNFRFQNVFSNFAEEFEVLAGVNSGKMFGSDGRLKLSQMIIRAGDEANMGKSDYINSLDPKMKDLLTRYLVEHKKLTDGLLKEAKDAGIEAAQTVVVDKAFYAPVKWQGDVMSQLERELQGGRQELYDLYRIAMLREPENAWMGKTVSDGSNKMYAEVFAEAFVDNNITRASKHTKVQVPNAEMQIREIEELIQDAGFLSDHGIKQKDSENIVKALRTKLGVDTSKKGADKAFNSRLKMDHTASITTRTNDGKNITIRVGDLKAQNLEESMSRYNSSLAGSMAFAQTLGIRSYRELEEKMLNIRKEIEKEHGTDSKYLASFDKEYKLDSKNSVVDHIYTGRAMYEGNQFVQGFMKYLQAIGLMMLPLTMTNEMLAMSTIGGYKALLRNSPPFRSFQQNTKNGKLNKEMLEGFQSVGVIMNHYTNNGSNNYTDNFDGISKGRDQMSMLDRTEVHVDHLSNITNKIPQEYDHAMRNTAGALATEQAFELGLHLRDKKIQQLLKDGSDSDTLAKLQKQQSDFEAQFDTKHKGSAGDHLMINETSLGEFGMSTDDLIEFAGYLQENAGFAKSGLISKKPVVVGYSLEKLAAANPDLYHKAVRGYTKKVIDSAIQQNYKGQSVPWLENNLIAKMVFQFRTHPMQAFTNHARKYTDMSNVPQAKRLAFYIANISMAGAIVETARVGLASLGYEGKEKEKYLNENLTLERMITQGFAKSSYVGLLGDIGNGISNGVFGKSISSDYGYTPESFFDNPSLRFTKSVFDGVTGGAGAGLNALTGGMVGEPMSNQKLRSAMSALPFLALPMAKDGASQIFYDGRKTGNTTTRLFESDDE